MRILITCAVAILVASLLLPATGICAVEDEVVILGGENEKPPTNAANYSPETAEVSLDGALFFRIRTGAIGYTVAERENIVLKRLVEIMSSGEISPVYVDEVRGKPTVYVDKVRLITVYPVDVEASEETCPMALAEKWADGVRKGLLATAPSACFGSPDHFEVAIGGVVFFRLVDPYCYENVRRRGEVVDQRMAKIAAQFDSSLLSTMPVRGGGVSVLYDGATVVTATQADAKARQMCCPQTLADAWARNLAKLMPLVTDGKPLCGCDPKPVKCGCK